MTTWDSVFEPTQYLESRPYFQELLARFQCPVPRVRLHRLEPGAVIKTHGDSLYDEHSDFVRIHLIR